MEILSYTVKICFGDWFNKQVDWPISEQDKLCGKETENDEMSKSGVKNVATQTQRELEMNMPY